MYNVNVNCGGRNLNIGLVANKEQGEKRANYLMDEFYHLQSLSNLVLGAVNTIAGKAIKDAKDELYKRKDLWRHGIKKNVHNAEEAYYRYENLHTSNFKEKYNLFLDYLSAVEDEISADVEKLKLSIWQVFTKAGYSDGKLKAEVEVAWVLTQYACCVFDGLMKEAKKKTGFDYTPFFIRGRLTAVAHWWNLVNEKICQSEKGKKEINFDDDPNCKLGFRIIEKKLMSEELLNKAGYIALKQNMELIGNGISEKDYHELVDRFEK